MLCFASAQLLLYLGVADQQAALRFDSDVAKDHALDRPLGDADDQSGAIGAPAAVLGAVADALAPLGVAHVDAPATPDRVWHAIRAGA